MGKPNVGAATDKFVAKFVELFQAWYDSLSSDDQKSARDKSKSWCDDYMETDSYKNGETNTFGYGVCCDVYGFCGGLSGWWIFFIILIVLGCLAAAGAAFWFFYLKRKMGGRDGENSEDTDSMESSTKIDNSDIEISVDTY